MAQELISHKVLSLDFWQDTVTYAGSVMPTGTIGCAVLNIPDETITRLDAPCMILNQLLTGIGLKNVDMQLLPKAQEAGRAIIHELHDVQPFSHLDRKQFEDYLTPAFSEEAFAELNKTGELSDEELDNVSGGCGRDYEPSGETPKFHVGDRLAMVHPVIGRSVAVRVTYVSSVKSCMNGVNVFTYNTEGVYHKESFTNVAEYDLGIAEWVK